MNGDVKTNLKKSSRLFIEHIKEPFLEILGCGYFEIVEGITIEHMAKVLDNLGGIDIWHINYDKGIRGIASRIQITQYSFNTFTIRKERESGARTEYEKRKYAIENGYEYPYLTMQGYINLQNKLLNFAVARTEDIIKMIDDGKYYEKHTGSNQIGQASFYVVKWQDMKIEGYEIKIYPLDIMIIKKPKQLSIDFI